MAHPTGQLGPIESAAMRRALARRVLLGAARGREGRREVASPLEADDLAVAKRPGVDFVLEHFPVAAAIAGAEADRRHDRVATVVQLAERVMRG